MLQFKGSQSLSGAVTRSVPKPAHSILLQAYNFALENGGWTELDFTREDGVSYNPRPARIALILINDASTTDADILAAAMISEVFCAPEENLIENSIPQTFSQEIKRLVEGVVQIRRAKDNQNADYDRPAMLIHLASWLDRARHLHQATTPQSTDSKLDFWQQFLSDTDQLIPIAVTVSEPLANLLVAWRARFLRFFESATARKMELVQQ